MVQEAILEVEEKFTKQLETHIKGGQNLKDNPWPPHLHHLQQLQIVLREQYKRHLTQHSLQQQQLKEMLFADAIAASS